MTMDANEKFSTYRLMLVRQIAAAIRDDRGEGPLSIATVAVELAELNGLLDPIKAFYALDLGAPPRAVGEEPSR